MLLTMSINRVYYAMLQNLDLCPLANINERICYINRVTRITGQPTCETKLFAFKMKGIPSTCQTQIIKGNFERWVYIQDNEWIFSASHPPSLTITCSPTHIEDVKLKTTGIIRLGPQCKGYTETVVLESSQGITANRSHILMQQIPEEDCCPKSHEKSTIIPIRLEPVKVTDINTEELKYSNHKLIQLENFLQKELNKPVIVQHNRWSTVALSVTISIVILVLAIYLLRRCDMLRSTIRCLCLIKDPKSINDSCCLKIINTNVNSGPVTSRQLVKLLEEEDGSTLEEGPFNLLSTHSADGWQQYDTLIRPVGQPGLRRPTSRAPSVNMD
nr:PREDICTED: uncharacterized protein LOC105663770 [Megachile rotundata]